MVRIGTDPGAADAAPNPRGPGYCKNCVCDMSKFERVMLHRLTLALVDSVRIVDVRGKPLFEYQIEPLWNLWKQHVAFCVHVDLGDMECVGFGH